MECGVAAALRRRIPHGGGLLGVVQSASFGFLSTQGHATGFGDLWALLLVGAASDVECVCVCLRSVSELSLTEQSCLVEIC